MKDINYAARNKKKTPEWRSFVGVARFELTISWSQTKRDTGLRYTPKNFNICYTKTTFWRREGIKRFLTYNYFL